MERARESKDLQRDSKTQQELQHKLQQLQVEVQEKKEQLQFKDAALQQHFKREAEYEEGECVREKETEREKACNLSASVLQRERERVCERLEEESDSLMRERDALLHANNLFRHQLDALQKHNGMLLRAAEAAAMSAAVATAEMSTASASASASGKEDGNASHENAQKLRQDLAARTIELAAAEANMEAQRTKHRATISELVQVEEQLDAYKITLLDAERALEACVKERAEERETDMRSNQERQRAEAAARYATDWSDRQHDNEMESQQDKERQMQWYVSETARYVQLLEAHREELSHNRALIESLREDKRFDKSEHAQEIDELMRRLDAETQTASFAVLSVESSLRSAMSQLERSHDRSSPSSSSAGHDPGIVYSKPASSSAGVDARPIPDTPRVAAGCAAAATRADGGASGGATVEWEIAACRELVKTISTSVQQELCVAHGVVCLPSLLPTSTTLGLVYDQSCRVSRVLVGGPAFLSGKIHEGDILVAINGIALIGLEQGVHLALLKGEDDIPGSECRVEVCFVFVCACLRLYAYVWCESCVFAVIKTLSMHTLQCTPKTHVLNITGEECTIW